MRLDSVQRLEMGALVQVVFYGLLVPAKLLQTLQQQIASLHHQGCSVKHTPPVA